MWEFALPWSHIYFFYHVLYITLTCPHASSRCLVGLATLSQHRFRSWNGMPSSCGSPIIHGGPEPTQEIPAICLVSGLTLISMTVNISQNLACPDPRVPLLSKHSLGRQTVSVVCGDTSGTILEWEHAGRDMSHIHKEWGHTGEKEVSSPFVWSTYGDWHSISGMSWALGKYLILRFQ